MGLFGASGCGKTTKARELTQGLARVVFFEPLADDFRRLLAAGYTGVNQIDRLFQLVNRNFTRGFKIAYYPACASEEKDLSEISDKLMLLQQFYGLSHQAKITLVVDELDMSFPTGVSLRNPRNGFKNLCCRGRHTGINIVAMSQRMHLVDNVFRANCSAVYLFRHSEPADIDVGLKILGREYREQFKNLANFQYFYKSGPTIFLHR